MKTAIKLILVFSLMMILCSCNQATAPETTAAPTTLPEPTTPTTIATEPTEQPIHVDQVPMLAISLPTHSERIVDSGTVVYEHISQDMNLFMTETDVAERIILDFLNRTDTAEYAQQIAIWAKEDYEAFPEDWVKYLCQSSYAIKRFDAAVLSLYGTHIRFADINMADGYHDAVTYDMTTGLILDLPDILPSISREELTELVTNILETQKEQLQLFPEFPEVVADRFTGSLESDKAWYLNEQGLCFYFPAYEIAPGATGIVTVEIPYSKLAGKMNDSFFLPEQEIALGELQSMDASDENMTMFTQFAEIAVDSSEEKALLYTDLSITNLRIEIGNRDNGTFHSEHTIFMTPTLTPGDAILLECSERSAPKLRISYDSNGSTKQLYVARSDDSYTILPTE